jgi:hypothetical protein
MSGEWDMEVEGRLNAALFCVQSADVSQISSGNCQIVMENFARMR